MAGEAMKSPRFSQGHFLSNPKIPLSNQETKQVSWHSFSLTEEINFCCLSSDEEERSILEFRQIMYAKPVRQIALSDTGQARLWLC